jgi:hypothetical protein
MPWSFSSRILTYPTKIAKLNFIGNAVDLGSVEVDKLTAWMYRHPGNPSSFEYPSDRLRDRLGPGDVQA